MESCCSRFTAAEGGARLAAAAGVKNLMITEHTSFISTSLLMEYAHRIRGTYSSGYQRSIYITKATRIKCITYELKILTDLAILGVTSYDDVEDWSQEMEKTQVIVCTSKVLKEILENDVLNMLRINVLIIDSCHLVFKDQNLKYIMKLYKECDETKRPRILAMTYPLFQSKDHNIDTAEDDSSDIEEIHDNNDNCIHNNDSKTAYDILVNEKMDPKEESNENNDKSNDVIDKQNGTTLVSDKNNMDEGNKQDNDVRNDCDSEQNNKDISVNDINTRNDLKTENEQKNDVTPNKEEKTDGEESNNDIMKSESNIERGSIEHGKHKDEIELNKEVSEVVLKEINDCNVTSNNDDKTQDVKTGNDVGNIHKELTNTQSLLNTEESAENNINNESNDKIDKVKQNNDNASLDPNKGQDTLINDRIKKKNDKSGIRTAEEMSVYENLDDFDMYEKLEWKIEELERELCCEMDLAEDIDGGKRLSPSITKPKEVIIEYKPIGDNLSNEYKELNEFMKTTVNEAMMFINEHRYDPTEIYGDELYEEFMNIPDPTIEPKQLFHQFLYVLNELGPYAADKAAFSLLTKLEKLKIKVPYERHFLLLCLCTTVFVKIRCYADHIFSKYTSDWEKLTNFSTPKVLRFAAILEQFQPDNDKANDKCLDDGKHNDKMTDNDVIEVDISGNVEKNNCSKSIEDFKAENDTTVSESNDVNDTTSNHQNNCQTTDNDTYNNDVNEKLTNDTSNNDSNKEKGINKNNEGNKKGLQRSRTIDLLDELNDCDFSSLGNKIEDKMNIYEMGLKEINQNDENRAESVASVQGFDNNISNTKDYTVKENNSLVKNCVCNSSVINNCEILGEASVENTNSVQNKDHSDRFKRNSEILGTSEVKSKSEVSEVTSQKLDSNEHSDITANVTSEITDNREIIVKSDVSSKITLDNNISDEKADNSEIPDTISSKIADNSEVTDVIANNSDLTDKPSSKIVDNIEIANDTAITEEIATKIADNTAITEEIATKIADNSEITVNSDLTEHKFKRGRGRARGRPRPTKVQQQSADSLCGIVFLKESLMAKILFMIIVDMSRSRPSLSHLCAQYCAVESVDEPRESQRQGRKQEDVLKKFRMHECNLLLATSALEEGIDLPRCNLVVRWDIPPSYRSYGLCRSRARASKSSVALLANSAGHSKLLVRHLAVYKELDQIVTRKCGCGIQNEPLPDEESEADAFTQYIKPYIPESNDKSNDNDRNDDNDDLKIDPNDDAVDEEMKIDLNDDNGDGDLKMCTNDNDDLNNDIFDNDRSKVHVRNKRNDMSIEKDGTVVNEKDSSDKISESRDKVKSEVKVTSSVSVSQSESPVKVAYEVDKKESVSVDLNSAIALINRYCGKLPSDTFTRLAPQWWMEEVRIPTEAGPTKAYICTLRMPLNCPVKYNIVGHPMPTRVLARRMVALQACRILHKSGELDDQLMPIGKENFKAAEMETSLGGDLSDSGDSARPGTTKRRQYYYKRIAHAFTDCQPVIDATDDEIEANPSLLTPPEQKAGVKCNTLHALVSTLHCALPERYNTRGRRLHEPQLAYQALGILLHREPARLQIPAFPVYTRSGEVRVSVEPAPADTRLSPRRDMLVRRFMQFVFADVLRVRRRGMRLDTEGCTQNNYYVVPTVRKTSPDGSTWTDIDWPFLELIYKHTEEKKQEKENDTWEEKKEKGGSVENPLLKEGEVFTFDAGRYSEAVVTPWYRNQDQPQFFLVAEICWHLTPDSAFPSAQHATFRSYYKAKYGAELTQSDQPLLDVDHTSARLNLLTPRYVNRKGVALPVSSERTRRAKRDRLDQKQIMVPELCRVHPFAAPLWFATVALPCALYRINALLIADEIRRAVALDVGLGIPQLDDTTCPGFKWPALDFGWSLAEVLSADSEKHDKKKDIGDSNKTKDLEKEKDKTEQDTEETAEDERKEVKEKTLNDILQEKEDAESGFEIGTWSNDMASSIPASDIDECSEPIPSNVTLCTSATGGVNWSEPVEKAKHFNSGRTFSMADSDCSYMSSDFDTDDSDLNSEGSDEDSEGFCSSKNSNAAMGVRIEYSSAHEAEAVDVRKPTPVTPRPTHDTRDAVRAMATGTAPAEHIEKFKNSVECHEKDIIECGHLITEDQPIIDLLPDTKDDKHTNLNKNQVTDKNEIIVNNNVRKTMEDEKDLNHTIIEEMGSDNEIDTNNANLSEIKDKDKSIGDNFKDNITDKKTIQDGTDNANSDTDSKQNSIDNKLSETIPYLKGIDIDNGQISLESIERNKRKLLADLRNSLSEEDVKKLNCFSMKDVDIDSPDYINEKIANVGFDSVEKYEKMVRDGQKMEFKPYYLDGKAQSGKDFDFDYQPDLEGHPGPSPSVILQALTMSNANDGINLERLETIGDSFLKFAITAYLYCAHPAVHEGKLSHMRSKQVSNLNLYRLGRNKRLGARMIASKFEPHDNWLPPCHKPPPTLHPGVNDDVEDKEKHTKMPVDSAGCFIPYNLITQHSIPDKSIADCVEALIGAYLLECGPRGALLFMSWLGIRVLPAHCVPLPQTHKTKGSSSSGMETCDDDDEGWAGRCVGSLRPHRAGGQYRIVFGELKAPPSPLLRYIDDPEGELEQMLSGYEELERTLQYRFRDRSLLLQALTHASHQSNRLTDCYQRLEFLGDAILDYLITRHLYEDGRRHSPGALTDLRSALVNNTIFATLAARHGFHKYFRHMSPGLNEVLTKYVKIQEENGHSISEEHYLIQEDEMEQAEDVEVPKALGDLFESVAGAIFLDSGMSLGAVWRSYARLMMAELEAFSAAAPKSPVRELLEAEPDTAKFGKPERLADGRRVRVCVEVFGRGTFKGIGRNYRIAKGTAARCALRHLKIHRR